MIDWLDLLLFFLLFIIVATPKGKKPNNENVALAEVVVGAVGSSTSNVNSKETSKIQKAMDDYIKNKDPNILKQERVHYSHIH